MPMEPNLVCSYANIDDTYHTPTKLDIIQQFILGNDIIDGKICQRKLIYVETEEHCYDLEKDGGEFFFQGDYICLKEIDRDGGYVHFIKEADITKIGYDNIPIETPTKTDKEDEWSNY